MKRASCSGRCLRQDHLKQCLVLSASFVFPRCSAESMFHRSNCSLDFTPDIRDLQKTCSINGQTSRAAMEQCSSAAGYHPSSWLTTVRRGLLPSCSHHCHLCFLRQWCRQEDLSCYGVPIRLDLRFQSLREAPLLRYCLSSNRYLLKPRSMVLSVWMTALHRKGRCHFSMKLILSLRL